MSLFEKINEKNSKKLKSKVVANPKRKEYVKQKKISSIEKNNKSVETFLRENKLPKLEIESVTYSTLTRETMNKISVCDISNMSKNETSNTVNDQRLGTIENNILCATCEKTNEECPGHMGTLKLPVDIIHPFFRLNVMKTLQCVCHTCNSLLLPEKYIKESGLIQYSGQNRLSKIAEVCKDGKFRCSLGCPSNPIFKSQKSASNEDIDMFCLNKWGKQEIPHRISVSKIKKILTDISDKDAELLGFQNNHPKHFIIDFIPVIPISARPYIIREGGQSQDDYITAAYSDIYSKYIEYFQDNPDPLEEERKKEECVKRIIFLIEHFIQNCNQEYKRSPSDPCKAINDRLSGKESLIRGHMMGKRCDFSGRTVLGPNRSISFGEIATPNEMKHQLSVPERVTHYNIDYVKKLSEEGKIIYL